MNEHDRSNLNFLMALSPEGMVKWFMHTEEDDYAYAIELLAAYERELEDKHTQLLLEHAIGQLDRCYNEANAVLSKFMKQQG